MPLPALAQAALPPISPLLAYLLDHMHVVGWPALVLMAARVCFRAGRFFTLLEARILSHETKLTRLADEDIPEIHEGITAVHTSVLGLHELVAARGR